MPVEAGMGLVAIQLEQFCLVKSLRIGEVIPGPIAPVFYKPVGHFGYRQMAAFLRAEVPGTGIFPRILRKQGAEPQIAAQGFQDVLPGPNSMGAADAYLLPTNEGADAIGNEAVLAPVSSADDVACTGRSGADIAAMGGLF